MSDHLYIWIPNWDGPDGFQHYRDRDPIWIKNYTRLLSHDDYMRLTYHQRGLLHSIWMEYARSNRHLPVNSPTARRQTADSSSTTHPQLIDNAVTLSRRLGHRILTRDLVALSHAGFIEVIASNVLAERLQGASDVLALARVKVEVEEETDTSEEEKALDQEPEPVPEPELQDDSDTIDFTPAAPDGAGAGAGDFEHLGSTAHRILEQAKTT